NVQSGAITNRHAMVLDFVTANPAFKKSDATSPNHARMRSCQRFATRYALHGWAFQTGLYLEDIVGEFHATPYRSVDILVMVATGLLSIGHGVIESFCARSAGTLRMQTRS
ncbi:hypothetical protein WQE_09674, partial [Paraburkholderia hospita]